MTPGQEQVLLDCIRLVFFISTAATVGMAMVIAYTYGRAYLAHRRRDEEPWRRLLPAHVVAVATSYLMLVFMSVLEVTSRLDWHTIHWRTPVLMVANVIGAYAMGMILRHSRLSREKVVTRLSKSD